MDPLGYVIHKGCAVLEAQAIDVNRKASERMASGASFGDAFLDEIVSKAMPIAIGGALVVGTAVVLTTAYAMIKITSAVINLSLRLNLFSKK